MERNLLFISKYPEIVKEFVGALQGKDIEIDTALNGSEAAACLKKKTYQVVVTGLALEGGTGAQIITYLNNKCPDTVCIIYTTNISPAQLYFFINERKVFRIFVRPIDFRGEFLQALEEAYEHYDISVKNREEALEMEKQMEEMRRESVGFERRLKMQEAAKKKAGVYMKRLAEIALGEYANGLPKEAVLQMKEQEWKIADLCSAPGADMAQQVGQAWDAVEQLKGFQSVKK